jgi:hypothetical protein
LASFHGAIVFTSGNAVRSALTAVSYALALGSLQIERVKFLRRLQRDASPRWCSSATSGSMFCALASARYDVSRL